MPLAKPFESSSPRVYIVGGGFAGIQVARALAKSDCRVTLVDRRNHHVFQPLLYQVATASLSPADIAAPIRSILRRAKNCRVILGEITGVDLAKRHLLFDGGAVEFDYLVLAAGATHSYFGRDDFAPHAPGLKSLEDATEMRRRILLAFETAEFEWDAASRRAALTFAIVGGGPTGVELAGAIKEIAAKTIPQDFRNIDTTTTRVILLQGGDRLLPAYDAELSERAKRDLEAMGVEVRLGSRVTDVTDEGVRIGTDEFVPVRNVFWAAGVKANPIAQSLGVPLDKSGRVIVDASCAVPGHLNVFVVGDMASMTSSDTKQPVPGVAQGALQSGRHVGRIIASELAKKGDPSNRPAFSYRNKGELATIGRARAVGQIGKWKVKGLLAWLLWAGVHVSFLIGFRNRVIVMLSWMWNWFLNSRDARLITGDARLDIHSFRPGEIILAKQGEQEPTTPDVQPAARGRRD